MGVWDFFSSSADSVKRNAPDLASVKSAVGGCTDSLKQRTPDLTSVKGALRNSYAYSCSAASWADDAVRVRGMQHLNRYLSGDESRDKIGELAANVAQNAAVYAVREAIKTLPGGGIAYNIVSQSIPKEKKSRGWTDREAWEAICEQQEEKIEALEARLAGLEKENASRRIMLVDQTGSPQRPGKLRLQDEPCLSPGEMQKPEDVISLFMMEKFMGMRLLDDLIIPGVRSKNSLRKVEAEDLKGT